jgi:hypothetical protein
LIASLLTNDADIDNLHHPYPWRDIMRTTLNIEDDAFAAANVYARARALKLGAAVSELIRRGNEQRVPLKQVNGVWVFDHAASTPRVTARQVEQLLDESA